MKEVKAWDDILNTTVESSSLELFRTQLDTTLSNLLQLSAEQLG